MSLHRTAAKRDASEPLIVSALEQAGFSVLRLSVKDGPDLLLGRNGRDRTAECKTGKAKLKPGQKTFAENWRGAKPLVLRSMDDALALIQSWPASGAALGQEQSR